MNTQSIQEFVKSLSSKSNVISSSTLIPVGKYNGKFTSGQPLFGERVIKSGETEWIIPYVRMDLVNADGQKFDNAEVSLSNPADLLLITDENVNADYGCVAEEFTSKANKKYVRATFALLPQL